MISEALLRAVQQSQERADEEASLALKMRTEEAMQEVDRLIKEFRDRDPELKRIVLFGSLASGNPRNPNFDIDLSFEGRELYACTAIALDSSFKVDLVDYRSLPITCGRKLIPMGEFSMKLTPEQAVILIAHLDKEFRVFEENCRLNRKA